MDDRDPLEWLEALAEEAATCSGPDMWNREARCSAVLRNALPELLAVAKALNMGIPRLTKACVCWPEEGIVCDGCAAEAAADALDARLRAEMGET